MILKEWSEAQDIYKATLARRRKAIKAILAPRKLKSYWYCQLLAFLFLIFMALAFGFIVLQNIDKAYNGWWFYFVVGAALIGILFIYSMDKAFAKEFVDDYVTHALSRYSFWGRDMYFTYALFLHELKYRKYSPEKIKSLSDFTEITAPPEEVPVRLFQHPLVIILMAVLSPLFVEFIKKSDFFQGKMVIIILSLGVMALFFVLVAVALWSVVSNHARDRHKTIQRYLQWAEHDMKEAPFS